MNESLTDERLREAIASLRGEAAPETCPSDDELWEAAHGAASATRTQALSLHAVECPRCARLWRIALELQRATGLDRSRQPRRRLRPLWVAAASFAAVMLVGAGIWQLQRAPAPIVPSTRAPAATAAISTDVDSVSRTAARLVWSGPEGATFDVRVSSDDLRLLVEAKGLTVSEVVVPASALTGVDEIIWIVSATLPDGQIAEGAFVARVEE